MNESELIKSIKLRLDILNNNYEIMHQMPQDLLTTNDLETKKKIEELWYIFTDTLTQLVGYLMLWLQKKRDVEYVKNWIEDQNLKVGLRNEILKIIDFNKYLASELIN